MKPGFSAATFFIHRDANGKVTAVRPAHDVTPAIEAAILKYLMGENHGN